MGLRRAESGLFAAAGLHRAPEDAEIGLLPALIALLAVALRVWNSDLTPFLDDEAGLLEPARQLIENHVLPATGGIPMSIHINEPPLIVYLTAIPMLVSTSPAWVTACFTFLDGLGTLAVYFAGLRLGGRVAAAAGALLYAAAPAAIYFTRKTDYFALTAFFTAAATAAAIHAWQERSSGTLAIALVAGAISAQIHASSALTLLATLMLTGLLWRRLKRRWPLAIAAAVMGATLAPYIYLQTQNGWADVAGMAAFLGQPGTLDSVSGEAAATLVSGGTYEQLLRLREDFPPALAVPPAGWLVLALVVGGLVMALRRRSAGHWLVAALTALPVLATAKHSVVLMPYYLLPIVPAAMVLAGLAVAAIRPRALSVAALAVIVAVELAGYVRFQDRAAAEGPALNYGMPLRYEMQAASLLAEPPGSRVFVAQLGNQRASFPYLTRDWYRISHADSRYGLPLAEGAYVVQGGGPPYDFLAERFAAAATVWTSSGRPAFGLFRLPADAPAQVERDLTPVRAEVGPALEIRGYSAPKVRAGQPSAALLEWRIVDAGAPLPPEVQQFMHLVDSEGKTWSTNADQRAYPRREWVSGDAVLSWFDLAPKAETPTGGYWLETGFYGYTTGGPLGPAVRLGPVRVQGAQPAAPVSLQAVFGGEIGLAAVQRDAAEVRLTWTALKQPSADYTVFVHVLNDAGELVAQHDGPPQNGAFPTTLWRAGDVIADMHRLTGQVTTGRLEIGLYRRPSLERLAVTSPGGVALGDHLELGAP
jgi:4-amino-4-deoxy-L-arabinose transferase-like glycosyltransferase